MVTNPWGIAGLVLALFLIYCLISMVSERRKIPTPDPEPTTELPPDHPNCRCVLPLETEWFDALLYVPGTPGWYQGCDRYFSHNLLTGESIQSINSTFMLFWTGEIWLYEGLKIFPFKEFSFRGLTEKVPT